MSASPTEAIAWHFAEIDLAKLRDYVLSPEHPRGRHKARVFAAALGIGPADAAWLAESIRAGLGAAEILLETSDRWGQRWRSEQPITGNGRQARLRCLWLVPTASVTPRLVTCYLVAR